MEGFLVTLDDNIRLHQLVTIMEGSGADSTEAARSPASNATTSRWLHDVRVTEMTIERSVERFNRISGIPPQPALDILRLANVLEFHHVPVEMAIAFIRNQLQNDPAPIRTYLWYIIHERSQFPEVEPMTDVEKAIFKTWILTLQRVVPGTDPHDYVSTLMATVAAFMEPDNVLLSLFKDSQFFPDPAQVLEKANLMKQYAIVSGPPGSFSIHPLLQRVIRFTLASTAPTRVSLVLRIGLRMLKPFLAAESEASLYTLQWALHAKCIWKYALKQDSVVREFTCIPTYICRKLNLCSKHVEQVQVARDTAAWFARVCGPSYFGVILMKYYQGQGLFSLKKYSESLGILNAIKPLAMSKLGLNSCVTLMILETIAEDYRAQERYLSQLEILELVLVGRMNMEGPEHMATLAAFFNQSITLAHLGRTEEALEIAQRIYQVCKRVRGENDFWTWVTRNWTTVLRFT